ncbi:DUF5675 family protein [Flavobacterium sp. SUN046]|uniref:DUF5675 family protein n=1 Tax=Flavobacterium sp. SUN046 TaxID=3002440 RepID=UPI002DBE43C0|nr:DUF5675 family protein [Flavobacterium sp. SUN046]MEC4048558.1 DUF5675 family protein [Flavobacterium sp. SUN046]
MVLELTRSYYPKGTNGTLKYEDRLICYTIELPWKDNKKWFPVSLKGPIDSKSDTVRSLNGILR